jgi:hypothetical protein
MTIRLTLDLEGDPERLRAFLRDPRQRPHWQSSLRRVEDVRGAGEVGSAWVDVTWAGLRPRMVVTEDTATRWAETGTWRGWEASLALDFAPGGRGTLLGVVADVVPPARLARLRGPIEALAARGIAGDLRRASRASP